MLNLLTIAVGVFTMTALIFNQFWLWIAALISLILFTVCYYTNK